MVDYIKVPMEQRPTLREHLVKLQKQWAAVVEKAAAMPERERAKWFDSWLPGFRAEAKDLGFNIVLSYKLVATGERREPVLAGMSDEANKKENNSIQGGSYDLPAEGI